MERQGGTRVAESFPAKQRRARARRGVALSSGARNCAEHCRGNDAGGGAPGGAGGVWRSRAMEGGLPRHAQGELAGRLRAGCAVRRADVPEEPGLRRRGAAHTRARHRREHRNLFGGGCGAAQAAAVSPAGVGRGALGNGKRSGLLPADGSGLSRMALRQYGL